MTSGGPGHQPAAGPREPPTAPATAPAPSPLAARVAAGRQWLMSRWAGRLVLRTTAEIARIELFDRSMTIAAQLFTSIFPILIMAAVWVGRGTDRKIANAVNLPTPVRSVLSAALDDSGIATFGIVGTIAVLLAATSLSRALTRALAVIWELPRPRTKVRAAWRWLAAVLGLVIGLVAVRTMSRFTDPVPPLHIWTILLNLVAYTAVALLVPWLLLAGQVSARRLAPGAVVFGLIMLWVRPAGAVYLPRALETSAHRYGPIGVAFTYLSWLYVVSLCFLAAATIGRVLAEDPGRLGRLIRRGE